MLVQIYLSFGTLAKVVCLAKKVSKDTFSSIITPVLDLDSVLSLMSDIRVVLPDISQRYMPWVSRIPLHQGLKWEPTWKALPTHKLTETMHPPHVFTEVHSIYLKSFSLHLSLGRTKKRKKKVKKSRSRRSC